MKNSNIQWIGDIPDDWEIVKIKYLPNNEVDSFTDGDWIDSQYITEQGIRYYTTGNIGDGFFKEQGSGYISEETFKLLNCKYAYPNDLVFSRLNEPYCRSCILPKNEEKYVLAVDNVILRTNENKKYICYVSQCEGFHKSASDVAFGSTMKRVSRTKLGNLYIPLPPLATQTSIATYLDAKCSEIDGLIADINKQIETLNELKKSTITEAVTKGLHKNAKLKDSGIQWIGEIPEGWSKCRLKYLCEITTGNEDTQNADPDGEYPFYVRSPQVERCKRYTFDGEGILIAGDGAGAGRIFHHVFGKYAVHQRVYRLYDFKINTSYLHYYLSNTFPNEMDRGSAQSTVPSMRLPMLLNFNILIPSESEQRDIATYLDTKCSEFDSIISDKQNQISTLESYKKSLIYEYVTGENAGADLCVRP